MVICPLEYRKFKFSSYMNDCSDKDDLLQELESNAFQMDVSEYWFTKTYTVDDKVYYLILRFDKYMCELFCNAVLTTQDTDGNYTVSARWNRIKATIATYSDVGTLTKSLYPARKLLNHVLEYTAKYLLNEKKGSIQNAGNEYVA